MKLVHRSRIDLNLLYVFDALMVDQNVTKAALRVGLTQSAVSHALGRLRLIFNDKLFIRSPSGVTPTAVAISASTEIRRILNSIDGVLGSDTKFDPENSERQFVLGLSDYAAYVLLPHLTCLLADIAPAVSLVARNTNHHTGYKDLADGSVEIIIGNFPSAPTLVREEFLFEEGFVCAWRRGNPTVEPFEFKKFLACRHLQISSKGTPFGRVDEHLKRDGLRRNVSVTVAHFLMAPVLVMQSNLVAIEPSRLFKQNSIESQVEMRSIPDIIPNFRVTQAWHSRYDGDAGHAWLRRIIANSCQGLFRVE